MTTTNTAQMRAVMWSNVAEHRVEIRPAAVTIACVRCHYRGPGEELVSVFSSKPIIRCPQCSTKWQGDTP
jgi:NAD-dependent SIR2 family protein deacetylase